MKSKKIRKVWVSLLTLLLIICMMPMSAYAASYSDISTKALGYGTSVTKTANQSIATEIVTKLTNKTSYVTNKTDSYSYCSIITFSTSTSARISESINVTNGTVSGSLGSEISKTYSFSSNYTRTYTNTISVSIPANTTYTLKANVCGDKVTVYYKYFIAGICTSKGNGTVYVPRYVNWIAT